MKKFWIIFSIIMAVLIGVNGFLFIPNSFAMTTIVSQNAGKIRTLTEKATRKLNTHDNLSITIDYLIKEDESNYTTMKCSLKVFKDYRDFVFTASVVRVDVVPGDDGQTEKTMDARNYYYNKGDFYIHVLANGEGEGIKIKKEDVEIDAAMSEVCGIPLPAVFMEFDVSFFASEQYKTKSSTLLTFKPFIFGLKFKYSRKYESQNESHEFYVDMFGNLRKYVTKTWGEGTVKSLKISYKNFKKLKIGAPSGLDNYVVEEDTP